MKPEKVKEMFIRQIVGAETGEILETEIYYEGPEITQKTLADGQALHEEGDYMLAVQKKMGDIANDTDLTGTDLRVYLLLLSKLQWDGWMNVNQAKLSRENHVSRGDISRAMKKLKAKDVILQHPTETKLFQLNAFYGYKGSQAKMMITRKQQRRKLSHLQVVGGIAASA